MPRVKSSLFNYISGKSGNIVFRQMNGKTFYSIRPDSYNISQSAKAKAARKNFSLAVKFARKVNEQPILKQVWSKAKLKGTTSYHRIIKYNAVFIKENLLTVSNSITPRGEIFPVKNYIISDDEIILEFDETMLGNSLFVGSHFDIIALAYLYNRRRKTTEENFLTCFTYEYKTISPSKPAKIILPLSADLISEIPKYRNCIIYTAAVFNRKTSGKIRWTSTVPILFPID